MAVNLSASGPGKKTRAAPVINVTPLVDVVLVVLIIFMIVTPMMIKTFWMKLPQQEKSEEPAKPSDNKPIVLTVDKDGVIRVNQTVLKKSEVAERVPRMLSAKDQRILYFDAHDEAAYGRAVEALDLARAGGVKSIAMLTEPVLR